MNDIRICECVMYDIGICEWWYMICDTWYMNMWMVRIGNQQRCRCQICRSLNNLFGLKLCYKILPYWQGFLDRSLLEKSIVANIWEKFLHNIPLPPPPPPSQSSKNVSHSKIDSSVFSKQTPEWSCSNVYLKFLERIVITLGYFIPFPTI